MAKIGRTLSYINTSPKPERNNGQTEQNQASGSSRPGNGGSSSIPGNLQEYLLKSIWDRVWEIKTDSQGNEYIFGKLPVVTQYGITMYADGGELNLPSIYAGLPIDNSTLIRDDNGVLKINPDIDLGGGASTWDELIGKPAWIGSTKPSYNYSEILQTPDLSVYALASDLAKYVTLAGDETIKGLKNFTKGLQIDGLGITKSQDDVIYIDANLVVRGGITMYATDAIDVPSIIDALPIASASAKGIAAFNPNDFSVVDGYVSFIGKGGVDDSVLADYAKKTDLSAYLPLSGGTVYGKIHLVNNGQDALIIGYGIGNMIFQNTGTSDADFSSIYTNGRGQLIFSDYSMDSLKFKQHGVSGYHTILHSGNWSKFVTTGDGGNYLPLTGGTIDGRSGSYTPLNIYSNHNQGIIIYGNATETTINYNSQLYGISWTTGINIKNELPNSYCIYSTTKNENVLKFRGSDGRGFVKFGMEFENSGLTAYASNGITIGGGDVAERYITCYGKNVGYINIGKSPSAGNTGELAFHYYGDGSRNNMLMFGFYGGSSSDIRIYYNSHTQVSGNLLTTGGITMYSDIRKKTKLQDVELSLKQIADAPLIEHYYNSDAMRTTHVGSIAQYWAGLNDWFCKLDGEGYYTMEIQNAALASAISIARELVKYESKTDRKIRLLKQRVKELEDKIEKLENN